VLYLSSLLYFIKLSFNATNLQKSLSLSHSFFPRYSISTHVPDLYRRKDRETSPARSDPREGSFAAPRSHRE